MALHFSTAFIPSSFDHVLATSTTFSLGLTEIINRTAPLNTDGLSTYSGIWSSSFSANADELFSEETRYTLYQRQYTNITVIIDESIFYISNVQEPIARQTEIIFRNLLFTIVVLELFGLLFLVIKLLLVPLLQTISTRMHQFLKKYQIHSSKSTLTNVSVHKSNSLALQETCITVKPRRRSSAIVVETVPSADERD